MLDDLPREIVRHIASYCDDQSVIALSRTSAATFEDLGSDAFRRRVRLVVNHLIHFADTLRLTMYDAARPEWVIWGAVEHTREVRPVDPADQPYVSSIQTLSMWRHRPIEDLLSLVNLHVLFLKMLLSRTWDDVQWLVRAYCRKLVHRIYTPMENVMAFGRVATHLCGDLASGIVLNSALYLNDRSMPHRPSMVDPQVAKAWMLQGVDSGLEYTGQIRKRIAALANE